MNAMRAMMWKEAREHAYGIALTAMTVGGIFLFCVWFGRSHLTRWHETRSMFDVLMLSALPLAGAALGALFVRADARGDAHAFLVHRPMKLTAVFRAKMLTACVTFLLACVAPVLIAFVFGGALSRIPDVNGHVPSDAWAHAPSTSEWSAVYLGLACIPLGTVFVLAGRWGPPRGVVLASLLAVPEVAMTMVAAFEHSTPSSGVVVAAALGVATTLAAQAAFIADDSTGRLPGAGTPALAVLLYMGLATIVGFAALVTLADRAFTSDHTFEFWGPIGPTATVAIACVYTSPDDFLYRLNDALFFYMKYGDAVPSLVYAAFAVFVSGLIGSAACGVTAYLWHLDKRAILAWALGGFAMGVLGPIVMFAVEPRPVFERCLACGKRRSAAAVRCEHCNAPAITTPNGSEVFAPLIGSARSTT